MLLLPLSWILEPQKFLLSFILQESNLFFLIFKIIVLLLPVLLFLTGLWITSLSVYTILFRSKRINYLGTLTLAWWDILTSIWSFWLGIIRLIFLSFGWLWELIRITLIAAVISLWELIILPFRGLSEMAKRY